MKEHVQLPGVRKWTGTDLIELQGEQLKVLNGFVSNYGTMILSGCQVEGNSIKPGIVVLPEVDGGKISYRIATFKGADNVQVFPVYLTLRKSTITREYANATAQPVAYYYEAVLNVQNPGNSLTVNRTGNKTFVDAVQDSAHRFVTDAQINNWNLPREFINIIYTAHPNDLTAPGLYYFQCENSDETPVKDVKFWGLSMINNLAENGTQLIFRAESNEMYFRNRIPGNGWTKWVRIWNSKTLKEGKSNTILAIKSFLPVRPAIGDTYMLTSSMFIPRNEGVPVEIYRVKVRNRVIGDESFKLCDAQGGPIDIPLRLKETGSRRLVMRYREYIETGFIPVLSQNMTFVIKTAGLSRFIINMYESEGGQPVGTINQDYDPTLKYVTYSTVFSEQVKFIRLAFSGIGSFSSAGVIMDHAKLPFRFDRIYKYTIWGWKCERVPGNELRFRDSSLALQRMTRKAETWNKVTTKVIPKIEFKGVTPDGNIEIRDILNSNEFKVCLFVRKRIRHRSFGSGIKPRKSIRYVEKTKQHAENASLVSRGVVSREPLVGDVLPYSVDDLYKTAFKVFADGNVKRTDGLVSPPERIPYAEIAMCLSYKVGDIEFKGEMSYFTITAGHIREK